MPDINREGEETPGQTGLSVRESTLAQGSDDEIVRLKKDIDDMLVDVTKSNSRNEPPKRVPQAPYLKPETRDERIGVSPFQMLLTIVASIAFTFVLVFPILKNQAISPEVTHPNPPGGLLDNPGRNSNTDSPQDRNTPSPGNAAQPQEATEEVQDEAREPVQAQPEQAEEQASDSPDCYFKSYKNPSADYLGCTYSTRTNSNGHEVVDVAWADGYKARYIFWRNYKVEIWDSNKRDARPELAAFETNNKGVKITTNEGSVTLLPGLNPRLN